MTPAPHWPLPERRTTAGDPYGFSRMLMDGALERLEVARRQDPSERADAANSCRLVQSAVVIIGELRAGLHHREGCAVAANVDDLYDYMCRRLQAADSRDEFAALHEVSHLLDALRAAWVFLPLEMRPASRN